MTGLKIAKTASFLPPTVVTNNDMKAFVDTDDEWITTRTGIKTRRFAKEQTNLDMAVEVGQQLVDGIDKNSIAAVIVATFTPDGITPTIACMLQQKLELPRSILAFDFNAACSGFVYGMYIAKGILLQNPDKQVLLIGSEKTSDYLDFTDRNTCILFGDGAGGALLTLQDTEDVFTFETIGNDKPIVCNKSTDYKIQMNGKEVFQFAVKSVIDAVKTTLVKAELSAEDVDHFVCHQANYRIISHIYKKMGIDESKFFVNLDKYGNTSSASIPIALDEMVASNRLKTGDKVMFIGFGAGLTWCATLITW